MEATLIRDLAKALRIGVSFALYLLIRRVVKTILRYVRANNVSIDVEFPIVLFGGIVRLPLIGTFDIESIWDVLRDRIYGLKINGKWTIIDCGANMGISTRIYALQNRYGHVIAIEPNSEILPKLIRNTNDLKNVTILPIAVAPKSGYVELYVAKDHVASSLFKDYAKHKGRGVVKFHRVNALTLNDVLKILRINYVDLLLLDVEGLANDILLASYELLSKGVIKTIKVDLADYDNPHDIHDLIVILMRAGYEVSIIENTLYAKKK